MQQRRARGGVASAVASVIKPKSLSFSTKFGAEESRPPAAAAASEQLLQQYLAAVVTVTSRENKLAATFQALLSSVQPH